MIDQTAAKVHREQHDQNQHHRLEHAVQQGLLADFHQIDPVPVGASEIVLVLNALIEIGQIFLIDANAVQGSNCRCGAFRGTRAARRRRFGLALGLLGNRLLAWCFRGYLLLQNIMSLFESGAGLLGLVQRLLHLPGLIPQPVPGGELGDASPVSRPRIVVAGGRGMIGLELVLGSLVMGELALNSAEAVGSGADQVTLCVF